MSRYGEAPPDNPIMKSSLNALIGSATRIAVLGNLLLHPDREIHLRSLVRATGFSPRAVNKEVDRLMGVALLTQRRSGNRRYLRANVEHPLYRALRELLAKTVGVVPALRQALTGDARIALALLYGSVAAGDERPDSDIDLLVVGSIGLGDTIELLRSVQEMLQRDVNPIVMSLGEFQRRRDTEEHLVTSILKGPQVELAGSLDDAA